MWVKIGVVLTLRRGIYCQMHFFCEVHRHSFIIATSRTVVSIVLACHVTCASGNNLMVGDPHNSVVWIWAPSTSYLDCHCNVPLP